MKKTNFDRYLEDQMQDPKFAARFERAGEAWDVALQIAALREQAGLSQKQLARRLKTSQQQISRLESPGYEGHSLATLRRVAEVPARASPGRFRSGGKRHRQVRGRSRRSVSRQTRIHQKIMKQGRDSLRQLAKTQFDDGGIGPSAQNLIHPSPIHIPVSA